MSSPRPPVFRHNQPTYAQIPRELITQDMAGLSGAEVKVMLYLCLRAFEIHNGFATTTFAQLLDGRTVGGQQLDHGTGLTKHCLKGALKSLANKRLIWVGEVPDPATNRTLVQYAVLEANPYA